MSTRGDGPTGPLRSADPGQGLRGCYRPQIVSAGRRWLRVGPGGLVSPGMSALVFSDVSRVLPAVGDDFADGGAGG